MITGPCTVGKAVGWCPRASSLLANGVLSGLVISPSFVRYPAWVGSRPTGEMYKGEPVVMHLFQSVHSVRENMGHWAFSSEAHRSTLRWLCLSWPPSWPGEVWAEAPPDSNFSLMKRHHIFHWDPHITMQMVWAVQIEGCKAQWKPPHN